MAKAKVKKHDTFIDMTAMSDVTVLLLTFFMLTATFVQDEPVEVVTPASVSEKKIPETNLMTILVGSEGKVFFGFTNQQDKVDVLTAVGEDYGITFTPKQIDAFKKLDSFGVPIQSMAAFLDMPSEQQVRFLQELDNERVGIPTVPVIDASGAVGYSEFQRWVSHATKNNSDLKLAIKSDKDTSYPIVKQVIDDLRDLRQNRYLLITTLKTASNV